MKVFSMVSHSLVDFAVLVVHCFLDIYHVAGAVVGSCHYCSALVDFFVCNYSVCKVLCLTELN